MPPTTPTSVAAGDDEHIMEHMYRREAIQLMAQSGISKPSEIDIKAAAIKLRQKDEEAQKAKEAMQMMQQQLQTQRPPQPNLVVAPPPAQGIVGQGGYDANTWDPKAAEMGPASYAGGVGGEVVDGIHIQPGSILSTTGGNGYQGPPGAQKLPAQPMGNAQTIGQIMAAMAAAGR